MISDFKNISVLLVEDEEFDVRRVQNTIVPFSDRIKIEDIVADGRSALSLVQADPDKYDVIIMDYQIAGGVSGEDLIRAIKRHSQTVQIIVITKMTINITDFSFANRLLEAGAMWYCTKYPGDIEDFIYQPTDFILNIFNAVSKRRLEIEKVHSQENLKKKIQDILEEKVMIGETPKMMKLKEKINNVASHDAAVLIYGLSGTGKELVANHIHYFSKRKNETFVPINCGSLPEQLIESELFGHEKGSFTGATSNKPGLFEIADQGTVFLDEISELPKDAQVKLLRFLQDGEIAKIGRTGSIKVDVRIIAATNKDLLTEVKEKRFREDLYYRLNVLSINVPPLYERKDDIELLTAHFFNKFSTQMEVDIPHIKADAIEIMKNYKWPGNVRQLQNTVQRLLLSGFSSIGALEMDEAIGAGQSMSGEAETRDTVLDSFDQIMELKDMEKEFRYKYFKYVRSKTSSDAEAARLLGLAPPNYYRMCKELGLK